MPEDPGAARKEEEMRDHEQEAREHSEHESDDTSDTSGEGDPLGTPDGDAMPAPPGNIQGGNLGGAS